MKVVVKVGVRVTERMIQDSPAKEGLHRTNHHSQKSNTGTGEVVAHTEAARK